VLWLISYDLLAYQDIWSPEIIRIGNRLFEAGGKHTCGLGMDLAVQIDFVKISRYVAENKWWWIFVCF